MVVASPFLMSITVFTTIKPSRNFPEILPWFADGSQRSEINGGVRNFPMSSYSV